MSRRRLSLAWWGPVLPGAAVLAVTGRGPLATVTWTAPVVLFWAVLVVSVLCAVGAAVVVTIGWRRRLAEVTMLGVLLVIASVLGLVHGLTTPGVLYGDNPAAMLSAFLSVPVALAAAGPLIVPDLAVSRALARSWRVWAVAWMLLGAGLGAWLLARPEALPAPRFGQAWTFPFVAVSLLGALVLAGRQLRLHQIGRRYASLMAAVGFAYLGLSSLVWLGGRPFSLVFWAAHAADALGVILAIFGLAFAHARDRSVAGLLAPVVNRDPLIALELGLTPVVHGFLGALEAKDPITRDHVVRVGELAMRAGVRVGLPPDRLRSLGLGALLHDVGKLFIPDPVLLKSGPLTPEEFAAIQDHTVRGSALMATSPLLAPVGDLVRWHHERCDGMGYPDGLGREQIPLEVSVISVCDAWDAMTNSRQYRSAMTREQARQILLDGAGSQWHPQAVEVVLAELDDHGPAEGTVFAEVGRAGPAVVCADAIPAQALQLLSAEVTAPSPFAPLQ